MVERAVARVCRKAPGGHAGQSFEEPIETKPERHKNTFSYERDFTNLWNAAYWEPNRALRPDFNGEGPDHDEGFDRQK
jgi:hypothetical protein